MSKEVRGATTQAVIGIMKANRHKSMGKVCALIVKELGMTMSYARAWYRDFVSREIAPGKIDKAPSRAETRKLLEEAGVKVTHPKSEQPASPAQATPPTVAASGNTLTADQKRSLKNQKERERRAALKATKVAQAVTA